MDKTHIQKIPEDAGIYFFKDKKGAILYIGKAKNLHKRVAQYFSPNSLRKQDMLSRADSIDFLIVTNESEALYLEDNLIKKHHPEFNNLLKADNSYAYIKITKDPEASGPQIFLTRKKTNDGSKYIGPKHNTIHLKKFLQYLRQVLKFRGCKDTQFRKGKLCSDYHFGLCQGWCQKNRNPAIYCGAIKILTDFFKGNTKPIKNTIKSQIEEAIKKQNFERAAKLRDIYMHIQELTEQQTVVIQRPITGYISKIKKVGNYRLYCVLNFYEGKLIDVIRGKENIDDMDQDELEMSLKREFTPLVIANAVKQTRGGTTKKENQEIEKLIENFFDSYIISTSFTTENLSNDLLKTLQTRYGLKNFPYLIECIDISHLSGGWISGGLSCLVEGLKNYKGYRRYKIQYKKVDDYAALQEVLERRIKAGNLPDLLVLDGGKGQLGIIKKMHIPEGIDIVSLGKGKVPYTEKIYYFPVGTPHGASGPSSKTASGPSSIIKNKNLTYDEADKILIKARDEAHRFANAYRKKQMSKEISGNPAL